MAACDIDLSFHPRFASLDEGPRFVLSNGPRSSGCGLTRATHAGRRQNALLLAEWKAVWPNSETTLADHEPSPSFHETVWRAHNHRLAGVGE
jgi:hypothetical protein